MDSNAESFEEFAKYAYPLYNQCGLQLDDPDFRHLTDEELLAVSKFTAWCVKIAMDDKARNSNEAKEIEKLRNGYVRLSEASDSEMRDGDLARDIAKEILKV